MSSCVENYHVKFATYTFMDTSLTWWNNYTKTKGINPAYAITWGELKSVLIERFCPRDEIHKLEQELCSLTINGT